MEENKLTRIGIDVDDKILSQVDDLCTKEKWSRKRLAEVALEYYLKLRGYKIERI